MRGEGTPLRQLIDDARRALVFLGSSTSRFLAYRCLEKLDASLALVEALRDVCAANAFTIEVHQDPEQSWPVAGAVCGELFHYSLGAFVGAADPVQPFGQAGLNLGRELCCGLGGFRQEIAAASRTPGQTEHRQSLQELQVEAGACVPRTA